MGCVVYVGVDDVDDDDDDDDDDDGGDRWMGR